jgi:hypothetical protein
MALIERQPAPGLTHHSDRGVQYASLDYTEMLKQRHATISMSRKWQPVRQGLRFILHFLSTRTESLSPITGSCNLPTIKSPSAGAIRPIKTSSGS